MTVIAQGAIRRFIINFFGQQWIYLIGPAIIVFGIVVCVGGVLAIMRRGFAFAMIGAFLALFPTFILGLVALILIPMSKDEFR